MDTKNLVEYLVMVSNNNFIVNSIMHFVVLACLVFVFVLRDIRLRKYVLEGSILILLLSVCIHAVAFGNPFHAVTFGMMVVMAAFVMIKYQDGVSVPPIGIRTVVAFAFILLGLWYPEFAKTDMLGSLLVSPVGIVPCPTLITVIGMMSLFYTDMNKKFFGVVVFFGIVYGCIGVFKFGVYFDLSLLAAVAFAMVILIAGSKKKAVHGSVDAGEIS